MEYLGIEELPLLRTLLPFAQGVAPAQTMQRTLARLNPRQLELAFPSWVSELVARVRGVIAIDGKIIKGGGDYVLALKGNQGSLHDDVVTWFTDPALVGTSKSHHSVETGQDSPASWLYAHAEHIRKVALSHAKQGSTSHPCRHTRKRWQRRSGPIGASRTTSTRPSMLPSTKIGLVTVWFRLFISHYATLASKAKGLMPPRYEWRRRAL
jgi:hypothetical protein